MARPEILNAQLHKDVRVITAFGAEYGDNVHIVPVTVKELANLVTDYPVLITKDPETGQFELSALLGFEPGENLYLGNAKWNSGYRPLHLQRQPFMLCIQTNSAEEEKAVVSLDMDSKRVLVGMASHCDIGERLFDDTGEITPQLSKFQKVLSELIVGSELSKVFLQKLLALELIEPARLDVAFAGENKKRFEGIYTVNAEKLASLNGLTLQELHERGYLQACHFILASLGNISKLVSWKK